MMQPIHPSITTPLAMVTRAPAKVPAEITASKVAYAPEAVRALESVSFPIFFV